MKPGAWAPFVPGKPFKKPLPQLPCGVSGDKGRRLSGPSGTPPSERPFQPQARVWRLGRSEGRGTARGARAALRGREASIKTITEAKKESLHWWKAQIAGAQWVLDRWPKRLPSPQLASEEWGARATVGRTHRCVFPDATMAHSWPLQLVESERIFFSSIFSPSLRFSSRHGII